MALHVYGGNTFVYGKQVRAIVACRRNELPNIIGGRAAKAYVRNYWSMTGNRVEIQVALSKPGVLFYKDKDARGETKASDYHEVDHHV